LAGEFGIELPPQPIAAPVVAKEQAWKRPSPQAAFPEAEGRVVMPPTHLPDVEVSSVARAGYRSEAEDDLRPAEIAAEIEAELTAWEDLEPTATEPQSFEPQEALDVMDETADEFDDEVPGEAAATSGEKSSAEEEERRGRGRRRRRRGRGRGRDEAPSSEAQPAASDQEQASEEPGTEGGFGAGLEMEPAESAEGEPSEEDRGERRPHDRGRRGRHRRREESFEPAEETAGEESPEFAESDEDETVHAGVEEPGDFEADDEFDEGEDGGESPRIGFRNIPTWHDAIGVMIEKNMESRARNPGGPRGPGGRGRGGRDRGRGGRGGRDRRPDRR
jgi:hypothetical protein